MSRKTKSEISFLFKISILFIILFTSKLSKPHTDESMAENKPNKDSTLVKSQSTLSDYFTVSR